MRLAIKQAYRGYFKTGYADLPAAQSLGITVEWVEPPEVKAEREYEEDKALSADPNYRIALAAIKDAVEAHLVRLAQKLRNSE